MRKQLNDYSVSTKVISAFAVVLVATLVLGFFSNARLYAVDAVASQLGERWLPDMQQLGKLQYSATRFRSWEGAVLMSTTAERRATALQKLETLRAGTEKLVHEFDQSTDTPEEKALGSRVAETWAAYGPMLDRELAIEKESGQVAAFDFYMGPMMKDFEEFRTAVDAAIKYHTDGGTAAVSKSKETYASSRNWNYGAMGLAMLLCIGAGYLLIRSVSRPLIGITGAMEQLAGGNLDAHVPHADQADEIGKLAGAMTAFKNRIAAAEHAKAEQTSVIVSSIGTGLDHLAKGNLAHRVSEELTGPFAKLKADFNTALLRLQDTVKNVLSTSSQITTGAGEISQAADDLSRRTEQQAASLEETAAALEEITATVKRTAANAKDARASVTTAKAAAEEGGKVVDTAINAMDGIAQSSKQITDIIGVIDEIAFQTNLLALNAGVEAARAGDAGRGFAVVATEVRALAGRSSDAAKQIKSLIHTSSEQVETGVRLVGESGAALRNIVDQVQKINALVTEMAQAAEQQSVGIEQVNAAVSQMDQVTQQNAAMVEESTAASRNLADETRRLQDQIGFFDVGREAAARMPAKPMGRSTPVPPAKAVAAAGGRTRRAAAPSTQNDWAEF